jgi:predicted acetyltransferase
MNITVTAVSVDEKEILRNLIEKYLYEFSQYDGYDVNDLGLYGYSYLDIYWTEENRFAYFIKVDNKLAGFFMVNDCKEIKIETDYTISEFFILHKYRKLGVGTYAVKYIFENLKGKYQLMHHPKNIVSKIFWNNIVKKSTNEKYEIIKDNDNVEAKYHDGTIGEVLIFEIK